MTRQNKLSDSLPAVLLHTSPRPTPACTMHLHVAYLFAHIVLSATWLEHANTARPMCSWQRGLNFDSSWLAWLHKQTKQTTDQQTTQPTTQLRNQPTSHTQPLSHLTDQTTNRLTDQPTCTWLSGSVALKAACSSVPSGKCSRTRTGPREAARAASSASRAARLRNIDSAWQQRQRWTVA